MTSARSSAAFSPIASRLGPDEAETLINRAYAADNEAVDLYRFTSILKSRLDDAGRLRVIEMMWEMAFADGVVHEIRGQRPVARRRAPGRPGAGTRAPAPESAAPGTGVTRAYHAVRH